MPWGRINICITSDTLFNKHAVGRNDLVFSIANGNCLGPHEWNHPEISSWPHSGKRKADATWVIQYPLSEQQLPRSWFVRAILMFMPSWCRGYVTKIQNSLKTCNTKKQSNPITKQPKHSKSKVQKYQNLKISYSGYNNVSPESQISKLPVQKASIRSRKPERHMSNQVNSQIPDQTPKHKKQNIKNQIRNRNTKY